MIKTVTHEEVTKEALGGAHAHASKSGVCHFAYPSEAATLDARARAAHLYPGEQPRRRARPSDCKDPLGSSAEDQGLDSRRFSRKPPTMRMLIADVFDDGQFMEVHREWAGSIVVGFAQSTGQAVGRRGKPTASPGGLPGHRRVDQEHARYVRFCPMPQHSARDVCRCARIPSWHARRNTAASSAMAPSCSTRTPEATVPKITVITRKAYGRRV